MKICRSFVTTIWNQVMSLLSVKLSGTHLVNCTVMATWHRVVMGSNFKITFVSEKHMVEDDVLFTNHLAGK